MVERIVVGALQTNCYIYTADQDDCAIIDPGGDASQIMSKLDVYGITPKYVLLTHGHYDHVAGLGELIAACTKVYHSRPRILVHRLDRTYLGKTAPARHGKDLEHLGMPLDPVLIAQLGTIPGADGTFVEGDEIVELGLSIIETPGHTKGSVCLYQKVRGLLFAGDTLFAQGLGRTDLPGGSQRRLMASIQGKLFALPGDTKVYPGHGPFTTIEREQTSNPFFTRPG
jgi:glyoxylase-like metal-dependent hydrolase (beta-lactamase superfamily II)